MSLPNESTPTTSAPLRGRTLGVFGWLGFSVLAGLEVVIAFALGFYLVVMQMVYIGCDTENGPRSCDYQTGTTVMWAGWAAIFSVLLATAVLTRFRGRKRRSVWWLPLVGIVFIVAIFFAGVSIIEASAGR